MVLFLFRIYMKRFAFFGLGFDYIINSGKFVVNPFPFGLVFRPFHEHTPTKRGTPGGKTNHFFHGSVIKILLVLSTSSGNRKKSQPRFEMNQIRNKLGVERVSTCWHFTYEDHRILTLNTNYLGCNNDNSL